MPEDERARLRAAFAAATASARQEGWQPDAADLRLHERVIAGTLTFDEAVAEMIATAQRRDGDTSPRSETKA